jgi:competence protein ComEA
MNLMGQSNEEAPVSFPLNINTATPEELMTVPGIGPSKASLIRNYIEMHGEFETIDELIEVPGIGPATLENLRPYLTV